MYEYEKHPFEQGELNPLIVVSVVLTVLSVAVGAFAIWAFVNYADQKNNVDQKVEAAVAQAKQQQGTDDEAKFAEREKQPTRQFVGPDDLGRVQLNYPKTWSAYVARASSNGYDAYFQPGVVPPTDGKTPFALRISIEDKGYEAVLNSYQDRVKKGDLRSSSITLNGETGNRLDGKFSANVQGAMVLFKVRDKTLRVYTESRTFQPDYDNIILPSLIFNR